MMAGRDGRGQQGCLIIHHIHLCLSVCMSSQECDWCPMHLFIWTKVCIPGGCSFPLTGLLPAEGSDSWLLPRVHTAQMQKSRISHLSEMGKEGSDVLLCKATVLPSGHRVGSICLPSCHRGSCCLFPPLENKTPLGPSSFKNRSFAYGKLRMDKRLRRMPLCF